MKPRAFIDYRERGQLAVGGFDPDVPEEGYYRIRLRRGAVPVGVHLFYGQTRDPETGDPMERWAWQATINGEPAEIGRVWPGCARDPINKAEHDYLIQTQRWGEQHEPEGPFANRTKPVDLLHARLPF